MNKSGLTLIEVIIAALILALTVGGTLYIFSTEKGVVARTGRGMQALDFVQQTLEELKSAVGADTWPGAGALAPGGHPGDDIADGAFKDKFGGTRSYTVTNIDADGADGYEDDEYKEVSVTVTWEEPVETQ